MFEKPVFGERTVEFRYDNGEICIYGTPEGLKKVAELILNLANGKNNTHIHLEDYELLTEKSLAASIAVFDIMKEQENMPSADKY